jgi:hypothetical protein
LDGLGKPELQSKRKIKMKITIRKMSRIKSKIKITIREPRLARSYS